MPNPLAHEIIFARDVVSVTTGFIGDDSADFVTQFRSRTFVSIQKKHPSVADRQIVQRPILVRREIVERALRDATPNSRAISKVRSSLKESNTKTWSAQFATARGSDASLRSSLRVGMITLKGYWRALALGLSSSHLADRRFDLRPFEPAYGYSPV